MEVSYDEGYAYVDGFKFRKDPKTGYYLSTKKIGVSRKRLHVYMWETRKGEIPKGYHVHHSDRDKDNNEIDNLLCMTRKEHLSWHGNNLTDEELEKRMKSFAKAQKEAAKWHKSEEGRSWHKEHAERVSKKRKPSYKHSCLYCNKDFKSYRRTNVKFCSPNCRTKHRRRSGVDNEKRLCKRCGNSFTCNKYTIKNFCSLKCKNEQTKETKAQLI
jgi:hypothetical protein